MKAVCSECAWCSAETNIMKNMFEQIDNHVANTEHEILLIELGVGHIEQT